MSDLQPFPKRQFASDNYSGICPEAWQALEEANRGHISSYGNDPWTAKAADMLRETFETDCEVFFVFNGTAANSLALSSLCQSYHSILCHESAHVECDECGAPEFFSNGNKLLLLKGENGKVEPNAIKETVLRRNDIHYPKPRALSITQATEVGTLYTLDELAAIHETCKRYGLHIHMDGARFSNAIAALNTAPRQITWEAGVDVLCLGGTKNGMLGGEAVIFFNRDLAKEFDYRCKQAGQLASKMRFMSAPWIGMLHDGVWLKHAAHANAMAKRLYNHLVTSGTTVLYPCEANSVFLNLSPEKVTALIEDGWHFYSFIGGVGCRFMCSWDTSEEDVDQLAKAILLA